MQEAKQKSETIAEYRTHETDTGSSEVQIAILMRRIVDLTEHFKVYKKEILSNGKNPYTYDYN